MECVKMILGLKKLTKPIVLVLCLNVLAFQVFAAGGAYAPPTEYPLGGVWRVSFGEPYDEIHKALCKQEMSEKLADGEENSNFATFQLLGLQGGAPAPVPVPLLRHEGVFRSGQLCADYRMQRGSS
jgi:hypothetical protein